MSKSLTAGERTQPPLKAILGIEEANEVLDLLPGVALVTAIMLMAFPIADLLGHEFLRLQGVDATGKASPFSGVSVAILLGLLIRNAFGLQANLRRGVQFSVSKLLRLGIILVGIKLSILDVLKLGVWGIPVVVTAIVTGLIVVTWFCRFLGLPPRLGTLIAAGTGICGVTAIVSVAPVIEAEDKEVAYAVANITMFGLIGMLFYPYVARMLFHTSEQVGLFLGTAIHDTSQVLGAAMTYKEVFGDEVTLRTAIVTKLTRNIFLAAVVPLLSFYHLRQKGHEGTSASNAVHVRKLLPVFVAGFILMALIRSIGDATLRGGLAFGLWDVHAWKGITDQLGEVWGPRYLLGAAMAGVGLNTDLSAFKSIGLRPFAIGFIGSLAVGLAGLLMALILGPYVRI